MLARYRMASLIGILTFVVFSNQAMCFVEPDRNIKNVGPWGIHQGRYSQGCVAVLPYKRDRGGVDVELWIGGGKINKFSIWLQIDLDQISAKAREDWSETTKWLDEEGSPELMFGGVRVSGKRDNYRAMLAISADIASITEIAALKKASQLIYTEHGSEQLSAALPNMRLIVDEINKCISSRK